MFSERDIFWMHHALRLANAAKALDEVPVGAVLVYQDQMVGEGFNQPITHCDPSAHAEIIALRAGAKIQNNYRLIDTTLYVTLEPCLMCLGAIQHARLHRVVFGAFDFRMGAVRQLSESLAFTHRVIYEGGLLESLCSEQLSQFFLNKRKKVLTNH